MKSLLAFLRSLRQPPQRSPSARAPEVERLLDLIDLYGERIARAARRGDTRDIQEAVRDMREEANRQ